MLTRIKETQSQMLTQHPGPGDFSGHHFISPTTCQLSFHTPVEICQLLWLWHDQAQRGKGDLPAVTRCSLVFSLCKCWTGPSYNACINGRPHALSLQASNRALPMLTSFCNCLCKAHRTCPVTVWHSTLGICLWPLLLLSLFTLK